MTQTLTRADIGPTTRSCSGCRYQTVYRNAIDWNTISLGGPTPAIACSRECATLIESTRSMEPLARELARLKVCCKHYNRAHFDACRPELEKMSRAATIVQSRGQLRQLLGAAPEMSRGEMRRQINEQLAAMDQPALEE